jgi:hypothetical protein
MRADIVIPPAEAARLAVGRELDAHELMSLAPDQVDQWVDAHASDLFAVRQALKVLIKAVLLLRGQA